MMNENRVHLKKYMDDLTQKQMGSDPPELYPEASVRGIVVKWLREHGCSGLRNRVIECECKLDEEFMCCPEPGIDCEIVDG